MGKRKSAPKRIDENKRQCLSWNMQDLGPGFQIVDDHDPQLQQEQREASQKHVQESVHQLEPGPSAKSDMTILNYPVQDLIDQTDFTVTIFEKLSMKGSEWSCQLAKFKLQMSSGDLSGRLKRGLHLPKVSEFWLYVNLDSDQHLVYFEFDPEDSTFGIRKKAIAYSYASLDGITADNLEASQLKSFPLVLTSYNPEVQQMEITMYCLESGLTRLQFASEGARPTKTNQALQKVLATVHGYTLPDLGKQPFNKRHDIKALYADIKLRHDSFPKTLTLNVQHSSLKPLLRDYQKQAVLWMLQQERYGCEEKDHQAYSLNGECRSAIEFQRLTVSHHESDQLKPIISAEDVQKINRREQYRLHCLYETFTSFDDQKLYYNRHGGYLVRDMPCFHSSPPGGILADEMGLGKTVEVLACMLLHPRTDLPPLLPLPVSLPRQLSPLSGIKMEAEENVTSEWLDKEVHEDSNIETKNGENTEDALSDDTDKPGPSGFYSCHEIGETHENMLEVKEESTTTESDDVSNYKNVAVKNGGSGTDDSHNETSMLKDNKEPLTMVESISTNCGDSGDDNIALENGNGKKVQMELYTTSHDSMTTTCDDSNKTENVAPNNGNKEQINFGGIDEEHKLNSEDNISEILPVCDLLSGDSSLLANCRPEISGNTGPLRDHDYCTVIHPEELKGHSSAEIANAGSMDSDTCGLTLVEEVIAEPQTIPADIEFPTTSVQITKKTKAVKKRNTKKTKKVSEVPKGEKAGKCNSSKNPGKNRKNKAKHSEDPPPETTDSKEKKPKSKKKVAFRDEAEEIGSGPGNKIGNKSSKTVSKTTKAKKKSSKKDLSGLQSNTLKQKEQTSIDSELKTETSPVEGVAKKPKAKRKSWKKKHTFVQLVQVTEEDEKKNWFSKKKVDQKEFFECVCGAKGVLPNPEDQVQCDKCNLWQHPECVHYDLADPYRGRYLCPHCHVAEPAIPSGATLIITPSSISHQWVEEIQKHIHKERLKVLVYTGVHKQGFVQPQTLANHHIVITTYETLRKEIDYVDLPHSNSETGRRFRHPKRFMAIPSPITAVEWWRVCLDEAQMVECTTTKTAEMALRLTAVNRWCVTGTPIQRGIDDLYGLFLFLGVDPFWVQYWWNRLLYMPYCCGDQDPLHTVLSGVMWRTAKADVLDQICLPSQTESTHWLTFSPVEEHFYRLTYQQCVRQAMQSLSKWTNSEMKLNSLDRYTLHKLLYPLTRLRQACCHPQAVRGEFLPINKSTMTMEELLVSLTKKVRLECEEAHRQCVFAMNGLGALDIIQDKYEEAVDKYREVLRSVEEHKVEVRTDPLQQLHTLHNLAEVLTLKPAGVAPTLRDDQLIKQAKEIRDQYLTKAAAFVAQAEEAWGPVKKSLRELQHQLRAGRHWWVEVIKWAMQGGMEEYLVARIKDDLADNATPDIQKFASSFRDLRGLQYLLFTQLEQLHTTHDSLVKELHCLSGQPSQDLINHTVECCLRPASDKILKTCPFCNVDKMFEEYETLLFSFVDKGVHTSEPLAGEDLPGGFQVSTRRQGTWADNETEKTLKILHSFVRATRGDRTHIEQGHVHMKVYEAMKKEFRCLRTIFMALKENVAAFDELDMATTRIRLRLPDEPQTDPPQSNIIEPAELDAQKLKFTSDKILGQSRLRKKLGQLLYLKNLAKAQDDLSGGQNPEPCPVCQRELGNKWSVLQCGHCFCLECMRILVDRCSFGGRNKSLRCAICRQSTLHADISYVCTRGHETSEEQAFKAKGDHSTKIEGVVSCLLEILHHDPEAKALVFSTWSDVLDILSQALTENNIGFKSLHAQNKFQTNLHEFRHKEDMKVLMLPVHSGANGLNLIEATHVLLVEPILNPAQELQAIGRVHRIGQTKPTTVHRFLVRGTIEERMHTLLQTIQAPVNSHNTEETNMTIGELTSLFQDVPLEEEEIDPNLSAPEFVDRGTPIVGGETTQGEENNDVDEHGGRSGPETMETIAQHSSVVPACSNAGMSETDAQNHPVISSDSGIANLSGSSSQILASCSSGTSSAAVSTSPSCPSLQSEKETFDNVPGDTSHDDVNMNTGEDVHE